MSDSNITEKSDVISWVKKEHEIMSDEGIFTSFQKLKKLLILIAPTSIHIERFTGCVSDWSILNNDCQFKNLTY